MSTDYMVTDEYGRITNVQDLSAIVNHFASQLTAVLAERDRLRAEIERLTDIVRRAVLADAVAELENSGQLAAAGFVARLAENTHR